MVPTPSDPSDPPFPSDPFVYLPMNGGLDTGIYEPPDVEKPVTFDASENDNHAWAHSAGPMRRPTAAADRTGRIERALNFVPTVAEGTVLNVGDISLEGSFTLAGWANRHGSGGNTNWIVGQREWINLWMDGNSFLKASFTIDHPTEPDQEIEIQDPENFSSAEWHFVAAVVEYNSSTGTSAVQVCRDGNFVAQETGISGRFANPGNVEMTIGGRYGGCNSRCFPAVPVDCCSKLRNQYSGDIDDVRVFQRALKAKEIRELFEEGGCVLEGDGTVSCP